MKIKVKKSYTYKEVCKIRDKAMELGTSKGLKAYQKYLSDYNKFMIAFNKKWAERQTYEREKQIYINFDFPSLKKNKCGYIDYMMQHLKSSVIVKLQSRTLHRWEVLNE